MKSALAHRGPDAEGVWSNDRLALGHRRLSIIDPSERAGQPMLAGDGSGILSFNGELYNFLELRSELGRLGVNFATRSDTEVLLHALRAWGPDEAVLKLNGMFSFAYYDASADVLWLGRDRLGIKGLSIAEFPDGLLFASEDKALLASGLVSAAFSEREIMLRLGAQSRDSFSSIFKSIERLPPASLWRISAAGVQKQVYWDAIDNLDIERLCALRDDRSCLRELEERMLESVRIHSVSDTRIAAACSGGVDSSLIAAMARRDRADLTGYVIDPQLGPSEAESAERVGRHCGILIRRVPLSRARYIELWPKAIHALESDGWHASVAALLALAEDCRADGVKVLLTGEGSDELFGGYFWQNRSMARSRHLMFPWSLFRTPRRQAAKYQAFLDAPFARSLGKSGRSDWGSITSALSPELSFLPRRIMERLEPIRSIRDRTYVGACIFDLYSHLQDLLHRKDRLGMACSVEMRVPFLENGVVDFALHLPRPFKYRNGRSKWLLKKVAEKYIPRENVYIRKKGFPLSEAFSAGAEALLRNGALADTLRWSSRETGMMMMLAGRSETVRQHTVGMEMLLRIYGSGAAPGTLSEELERNVPKSA